MQYFVINFAYETNKKSTNQLEEQTDQKIVTGFDYKRVWPHRSGGEHSSQEQAEWSQQFDGKSPSGAGRSAHLGAKLIAYL
jgi:hypothetical protein